MIDCFAMDFQAVGFAGEGGGTWGSLDNCIAVGNRETWKAPSNNSIKNGGHSLGDIGHGFWINSRPLNVKNCVAIDCSVGFGWTSRVHLGSNVYPGITEELRAYYGLAALPDTVVQKTFAVIEGFESNEAYSCNWGGSVAKKFPVQHHDLVSFLDGFLAWEVDLGFHWQYTGMYSMRNFDVIGFNPAHRSQSPFFPDIGLWPYRQTVAMTFISPRVDGFARGISFTTQGGRNTAENKAHKVIDPAIVNCTNVYTDDGVAISLPWTASSNGFTDVEELSLAQIGDASAGAIVPGYTEDSCVWRDRSGGDDHFVIGHDFWYTDSVGFQHRQRGVPNDTYGWGLFVNGQDEAYRHAQISKDASILTLISRGKIQQMMSQEGVWTSAAGDKVLLIPDVIQDRFSGEMTYFFTPVALRMPQSAYSIINPTENGTLGVHDGQDFTTFNPAGTPGLT